LLLVVSSSSLSFVTWLSLLWLPPSGLILTSLASVLLSTLWMFWLLFVVCYGIRNKHTLKPNNGINY
jgi:hypothetical protein